MEKNIRRQFQQYFGKEAVVVAAPGRVNLIGEHTDYNQGFVLPAAIDKRIYVGMARNDKNKINVFANQYQEKFSFSLDAIEPVQGWPTYLLGMIFYLQQKQHPITGMDVWIDGDVPVGAGMSSSAAICSAFGLDLNEVFGLGLTKMQIALTGQKTEHQFAGVKCGIMDQFASLHGKAGHVIKLDCQSLEYEYIPFDYPEYKIVLVNTMVTHSLAASEYNIRRQQCEEGVAILRKYFPAAQSLRDISIAQLEQHKKDLPEMVYRRCHFVTHENDRLLRGCELLLNGNLSGFGQLMYETHEGLSKWYEVSCPESDFLVAEAKSFHGAVGARQMGGGFGGCTINIVRDDEVENFKHMMQTAYEKKFNKTPDVYVTQIEDGAKVMV